MPTYVALLRGINLGGKNRLPMNDLVEIFCAAGCEHVRTYIQSGNVIFDAVPRVAARLPEVIQAAIAKRFRHRTPVVLRTAEEIANVARNNPFLNARAPEETLHVMFLADLPDPRTACELDPNRSPPDEFVLLGREIFLRLPNGVARSKLTNSYFDLKLGATSTSRNWRTVNKLLTLIDTL